MDIKNVKKAYTAKAKDAVTKEALQAVLHESHDASYKEIDIHKVKTADVLYIHPHNIDNTNVVYNTVPDSAVIGHIHTDVSGYKSVNDNLTIEELFRNAGRNFR